jgi:7,8-dihydro-6-hydroxymethylpterin-pyrophosphokinase
MYLRNFVLYPLKEIAPNWIHPKTKENINILIQKLSDHDKKSILIIKED